MPRSTAWTGKGGHTINGQSGRLPVIESCDDCGECCQVVTSPPFHRVFDESGEDSWERLQADRPDLLAALLADERDRRAGGGPFFGTACIWLEPATRRCRR